jgi:hypothetical protein
MGILNVNDIGRAMDRRQLEVHREHVRAQLSWAIRHGGDRELLNLIQSQIDRLSERITLVRLCETDHCENARQLSQLLSPGFDDIMMPLIFRPSLMQLKAPPRVQGSVAEEGKEGRMVPRPASHCWGWSRPFHLSR